MSSRVINIQSDTPASLPVRSIGLFDAINLVVGGVIGAGIFLVSSEIARDLPSPRLIVGVWLLTGLISFFGALAYAELGAMHPASGGQYVFNWTSKPVPPAQPFQRWIAVYAWSV